MEVELINQEKGLSLMLECDGRISAWMYDATVSSLSPELMTVSSIDVDSVDVLIDCDNVRVDILNYSDDRSSILATGLFKQEDAIEFAKAVIMKKASKPLVYHHIAKLDGLTLHSYTAYGCKSELPRAKEGEWFERDA